MIAALAALTVAGCGGGGGGGGGTFLPIAPPSTSYTVGGTVSGLAGTVVLRNNDKDTLTLSADGAFTFASGVTAGNPYAVSVAQQPEGQTCAVSAGQGTADAGAGNVTDVRVVCAAQTYAVGGTVSGLAGTLVLRNNGADELSVSANGGFRFAQALPQGAAYDVTVRTQPAGQICALAGASGTATAAVDSIVATCAVDPATVPPPIPAPPAVGYAPKAFLFSWTPDAAATYYRLGEDPTHSGSFSLLADNLTGAAYALQNLVLTAPPTAWRYALQACNATGCSPWSLPALPDPAKAIGYFKRPAAVAGNHFGESQSSIAFSPDGLLMAVAQTGALAVHLYRNDAGTWALLQTLVQPDARPASLSFSGEGTLVVGSGGSTAPGGQVDVYVRGPLAWTHGQSLTSPAPRSGGTFGGAVSVSSDGTALVVGEYGFGAGNFHVYRRTAGVWALEQSVGTPNGDTDSIFGVYATMSGDGSTIVVGAQYEGGANQGAAYVYTHTGPATWALNTRLASPVPTAGDLFGASVAITDDADAIAIGARFEKDGGHAQAGALYVFRRDGAGYTQEQRLSAAIPENGAAFGGFGVAFSGDGSLLAIASPGNGAGSVGVGGSMAPVGSDSGAVYIYEKAAPSWGMKTFVKATNPDAGDNFGYALALSKDGRTLAVGALNEASNATGIGGDASNNAALSAGAVYLY